MNIRKKRYHFLTDKEKEKVFTLFDEGVKERYIAERFSVSQQAINRLIRKREERA